MKILYIFVGLATCQIIWPKSESSESKFTRLLISKNSIYIGGLNELLKLERSGENVQEISKRDITVNPEDLKYSDQSLKIWQKTTNF